ncbi:MAG: zinc ribbon domain-containing protein [Bryobacteraceae bacterium]|nr:zinc ribbon domain-containing protein [Bryobacteraceae bacterium]
MPRPLSIHDTEMVEGQCTCGARLADDARFCHRCGRPVRDDDPLLAQPEPEEDSPALEDRIVDAQPEPAPPSAAAQAAEAAAAVLKEVSFRSPLAVRVGFLAASIVQLVLMLVAMAHTVQLLPLVLAAGGAYAVVLFSRRSGRTLSVMEGARMGWISGVFSFVISTVLFTAGLLLSGKGLVPMFEENLKTAGLDSANTGKALDMIRDPNVLVIFVVLMLIFNFLLVAVVSSLGGALGARLTRRG